MKFRYHAVDKTGARRCEVVEAPSKEEAVEILRQEGLFATDVSAAGGDDAPAKRPSAGRAGGDRYTHLATFARHLQILISSGTPLLEALTIVERQMGHPRWQAAVGRVRARVEAGESLSVALAEQPQFFDAVTRSLVAAGETAGELPAMLERLAFLMRRQAKLRGTVIGAMVYPMLLCIVGVSVLITLFVFVLPRFSELFKTLDVPLPPTTTLLIGTGRFMQAYWWAVVPALAGCGWLVRAWMRTEAGRAATDSALLRLPKFGPLIKNLATARLARLLGVLIDSHVPLLDSIHLVKAAAGNVGYQRLLAGAEAAVTQGEPMSGVFQRSPLVNPAVTEAIRNGERSGKLGALLLHVADYLDEENEIVLKALASIIEPVILIVMGAFVGFVAISMFLPLFDLVGMAQGGGHR
jgi:type II secretory pathway component PulF